MGWAESTVCKQLNLIGLAEGLDKDGVCPEELTSLPLVDLKQGVDFSKA